ncbi:hypothetical protein WN55_10086 [Dufourea novaeangliae]|uniref:Essential protein Yae1 N-terminal domain-containing protein n=1 Tax=Dufourea novaeangliae TaxID=178035 RepID=A0A154P2U8_DUFNO|nr:hypothetical protein WN55_10086 [Dufourea novaeangliae]
MDESASTPEVEESLHVAAKNFVRIINAAKKGGYREGVENGSDSVFQEGFDRGFEEGFKHGFVLGKFKSLLSVMPQNTEHPQDIKEILDKTRRGICYICSKEPLIMNHEIQKPYVEIIDEQKRYSTKVMQRLHQYFQPYLKDLNFD